MNKLRILVMLLLASLIGCSGHLRPNQNVDTFYVTAASQQYPTRLCGVTAKGEACLTIQDGPEVYKVLNGYFLDWLPSLTSNQIMIAQSGQTAYILPTVLGTQLLKALTDDNGQRVFEEWVERYQDDDRFFDRL